MENVLKTKRDVWKWRTWKLMAWKILLPKSEACAVASREIYFVSKLPCLFSTILLYCFDAQRNNNSKVFPMRKVGNYDGVEFAICMKIGDLFGIRWVWILLHWTLKQFFQNSFIFSFFSRDFSINSWPSACFISEVFRYLSSSLFFLNKNKKAREKGDAEENWY